MRIWNTAELANNFILTLERPQLRTGLSIVHATWSARSMPRFLRPCAAE
jgi:hypothetical protein